MFDVFGFYKFIKISYLKKNQKILQNQLLNKNIRGTIIISNEGLNGTISGKNKDIKLIKDYLHKLPQPLNNLNIMKAVISKMTMLRT